MSIELGIDKKRLAELIDIANNRPIKEGRHTGVHTNLQNASEEELRISREIAMEMIQAFIKKQAD